MNHRHLLPEEIDLLLDEDTGPGAAPLEARVAECAQCQTLMEEERRLANLIDELPRFAPSREFGDQVMSRVPVFVPWHVAARETLRQLAPRSRAARATALTVAGVTASLVTIGMLWLASRPDLLIFASGIVGHRLRSAIVEGGSNLVLSFFGDQELSVVLRTGTAGLVAGSALVVASTTVTLLCLRGIAGAAARRRQ